MRLACTLGLVLALVLGGRPAALPADETAAAPKVEVEIVKYDGMAAKVRQHKGKVIVVDFWATWCIPCKKEFPHLVELAQKHGADGLVAVSVSVDNLDKQEAVRKFLTNQKATFSNLLLDEPADVWKGRLNVTGVPVVYVFDRAGRIARKYTDGVDYAEVAKVVEGLLKQ